jgi:tetratricopeptide (TPR) repeat protein
MILTSLSGSMVQNGEYARALPVAQRSLDITRKALGEENQATARAWDSLASTQDGLNQLDDAVASHRKAVEIATKAVGAEHPDTLEFQINLGHALNNAGACDEAEQLLGKALAILRRDKNKIILPFAECYSLETAVKRKQFAEAEPRLLDHYQHARSYEVEALRPQLTRDALNLLVELYDGWGKPAKAAEYRALLSKSPATAPAATAPAATAPAKRPA